MTAESNINPTQNPGRLTECRPVGLHRHLRRPLAIVRDSNIWHHRLLGPSEIQHNTNQLVPYCPRRLSNPPTWGNSAPIGENSQKSSKIRKNPSQTQDHRGVPRRRRYLVRSFICRCSGHGRQRQPDSTLAIFFAFPYAFLDVRGFTKSAIPLACLSRAFGHFRLGEVSGTSRRYSAVLLHADD